MKKSASEVIRNLHARVAKLERQAFRFPRKPKPNTLTLVESEAGFHKFQVSGNATITLDDIVDFAGGAFRYFPSSQWDSEELDKEARRYSGGVYTDFNSYYHAFNKLFTKSIKKQVLISKNRSGDSIIVSFNAQGLYRSFRKIYSEGLHFLLNRQKLQDGPKVVGQLMDNVIRNFDSEHRSASRIARLENKTSAKKYTIRNDKATIMCNVNWQYNQTGRILISHLDKSLVRVASTKVMRILKSYSVVDVHTIIPHSDGVSLLIEFSLLPKALKGSLPDGFRDSETKVELTTLMDELMSLPNVILM